MNKLIPNDPPGVPDEESPEWTDEDFLWAVRSAEFGSFTSAMEFLSKREDFLRAAAKLGFERAVFLPFQPSKPGFLERAATAIESLLRKLHQSQHAAE